MMIEDEIFKEASYDKKKLLEYGFKEKEDNFYYETKIYHDEFKVEIKLPKKGKIKGKMIELSTNEEFFNFRLNTDGAFLNSLKEEYIELLENIKEKCFHYIPKRTYWVVPASVKRYDVVSHFEKYDTITWRQTTDIKLHDIVYIYIGCPISSICFKCEAIRVNFVGEHQNTMELKLIEKYDDDIYTLEKLRNYGLKAIRGARTVPENAVVFLNGKEEK